MTAGATQNPPTFEIGLCMAGAISGGAYAAGVVDFLLEALEEWEKRRGQSGIASHRVRIAALSGASAGGMVSAILCRALVTGVEPVRDPLKYTEGAAADPARQAVPYKNPLFEAWVENIDIKHLLATRDLADAKTSVVSGLDSTVLDQICRNVLYWTGPKREKAPGYVADPLDVYFTTTNLRGVAYGIPLTGATQAYRHMMTVHADYARFQLTWQPPPPPPRTPEEKKKQQTDAVRLEPALLADSGNWNELTRTALACGAFPVGLAPRKLNRKVEIYHSRVWRIPRANPLRHGGNEAPVPEDLEKQKEIVCTKGEIIRAISSRDRKIDPIWPPSIEEMRETWDYAYWNVDGGVMNNEPMEFVRRAIAGPTGRNERAGSAADRAVIMIDPFPNESPLTPDCPEKFGITAALRALFTALVAQARFKTEDLMLALDESVFSRYIIFPTYGESGANYREPAMCAATLGGFGGFLSEAFRRHDYALGRRNCQQFLRRHLVVLENNKLAKGYPDIDAACIKEPDGSFSRYGESESYFDKDGRPSISPTDPDKGQRLVPIIPLYGTAADAIPLPPRPTSRDVDGEALRAAISARIEAVVPRLIADLPNGVLRLLLRILWGAAWLTGQRGKIVDAIMEKIDASVAVLDR
ncbi:MAG TPA: hypothetical protein VHM01_08195 [Alphaproteobacteria bacterium]|nr:hypothetical protein [Alphaproteobacteria bacterium]